MAPLFPREFILYSECFYGNQRCSEWQNLGTAEGAAFLTKADVLNPDVQDLNHFSKSTLNLTSRDEELALPSKAHPYQTKIVTLM